MRCCTLLAWGAGFDMLSEMRKGSWETISQTAHNYYIQNNLIWLWLFESSKTTVHILENVDKNKKKNHRRNAIFLHVSYLCWPMSKDTYQSLTVQEGRPTVTGCGPFCKVDNMIKMCGEWRHILLLLFQESFMVLCDCLKNGHAYVTSHSSHRSNLTAVLLH